MRLEDARRLAESEFIDGPPPNRTMLSQALLEVLDQVEGLEAVNRDMRQCMRYVSADLAPGKGPRETAEVVRAKIRKLEDENTRLREGSAKVRYIEELEKALDSVEVQLVEALNVSRKATGRVNITLPEQTYWKPVKP